MSKLISAILATCLLLCYSVLTAPTDEGIKGAPIAETVDTRQDTDVAGPQQYYCSSQSCGVCSSIGCEVGRGFGRAMLAALANVGVCGRESRK